jgi:methionine synthase II (cobalamin-independent)
MKYEVIVSDLGTMYQGVDYTEAVRVYEDYALRSSKSYGRMSNKQVMLIDDTMKIIKQHKQRLATGT